MITTPCSAPPLAALSPPSLLLSPLFPPALILVPPFYLGRKITPQEGSPTRITPREAEIRAGKGSRKSWKLTLLTYHMGKEMSLQKFLTQMGLERPAGQLPAAAMGPGGLGSVAEEGGAFGPGGPQQVSNSPRGPVGGDKEEGREGRWRGN